jgi:hypothetical protein
MTHEHHFGRAEPRAVETRTRVVVVLITVTMVVEVIAHRCQVHISTFASRWCTLGAIEANFLQSEPVEVSKHQ